MAGLRPPEGDIGVLSAPVRSCLALLGGFGLAFLILALIERLGLNPDFIPVGVIACALVLFVLAAVAAHGRRPVDYYIADRSIPPAIGGMTAGSGVAGLLVIGIAGGAFATAAEFAVSAAGFLLGLLLLGVLFAPGLQRFRGFSVADFMAARFGGNPARIAAAGVAFSSSFLLLLAHLETSGPLLSTLLNLTPEAGFYVVTGLTLCAILPGGMRSLTWTQMVQYFVVALACLLPAGFLIASGWADGWENAPGLQPLLPRLIGPLQAGGLGALALPIFVLAAGVASLSPFLARPPAARDGRQARMAMLWAALCGMALVAGSLVLGQVLASQSAGGIPASGLGGDPLLLATPIFAGMPSVLAGLVMAGLLAGLLAIGQAALLSAAGAFSHDLWDALVDKRAPEGRRLFMARLVVIAVALAATWLSLRFASDPPALIGWALAIAAGGTFVPLFLGMHWRGCSALAGLFGMLAGLGVVGVVFLLEMRALSSVADLDAASGLGPIGAAALAMLAALLVSVAVSLVKRERDPDGSLQDLFAALRGERRKAPVLERAA